MIGLATLFVGPGTIVLDLETPDRRGDLAVAWVFVGLGALYLAFAIVRIVPGRRDGSWPRRVRDAVVGLGLTACPLAVMYGLAPWKAVAAVWVLPVIAFLFDSRHALFRMRGGGEEGGPVLRTGFLHVIVDPNTGLPDGRVVQGRYIGRHLSELSLDQLDVLLGEAVSDPDSVSILTGIVLNRRDAGRTGGDRSRTRTGGDRSGHRRAHGAAGAGRGSGTMGVEEAYQILGIAAGVSETEILAAHRRLMKLVHPDKGGSDYFASKLNEARDLLLGR